MATVNSDTTDGQHSSGFDASWDNVHDKVNGQGNPTISNACWGFGVRAVFVTGRSLFFTTRSFFDFNTSGISGTVSSATLKIKSNTNVGPGLRVLKSGHDPSDTSTSWYSTWLTGLGGTLSGWSNSDPEVVDYSGQVTTTGTGYGHHSFALNPDARSDLFSLAGTSDLFKVVLMDYPYDYLDSAPSGASELGIYFANYSGDTRTPVLTLTFAAVGYGNDVIGVDSGDISTINGIATANISKVNGV